MRHFLVFAAVAAVLAGAFYWAQGGKVTAITGRIVLRDIDGRAVPGSGAKVAWYPADLVAERLRVWLREHETRHRGSDLELRAARNEYRRRVSLREEAAGILRSAEKANSADLAICRARHREAVADAEDALRRLEQLDSSVDENADPARFLGRLPAAPAEVAAAADGQFRVEVPRAAPGYLVAVLDRGNGSPETLVWLKETTSAGGETGEFSNTDILTPASLARMAAAASAPEIPEDPPAR